MQPYLFELYITGGTGLEFKKFVFSIESICNDGYEEEELLYKISPQDITNLEKIIPKCSGGETEG